MKVLGIVLLLLSAGVGCLRLRREALLPLRIGRALRADLTAMAYQIGVCRTPLPELLEGMAGLGADWLWRPLLAGLTGEKGLAACWAEAVQGLPPPLDRLLGPLGPLLGTSGDRLSAAMEETREELTRFLRAEEDRQAKQGRMTAALCLSGASLLILVLM